MGIYKSLINLEEYFRSIPGQKTFINDLRLTDFKSGEDIASKLMTIYEDDEIDVVPRCDCKTGGLKGSYLLGKTCQVCGTTVRDQYDNIEPVLWLRQLEGMPKFINPDIYNELRELMNSNLDCVRWLMDTSYNPPVVLPSYLHGLAELIGGRTYTNFINNLDNIIVFLINHNDYKTNAKKQKELIILRRVIADNVDKVFTSVIPLHNKQLFVMEKTNKGSFISLIVAELINTVMLWIRRSSDTNMSDRIKSNTVGQVLHNLSELYTKYISENIATKFGIFRKHIYGTRSHFTFRSIIVSIPGKHTYDGIFIPWAIAVTVFRAHIMNKLLNKYKYNYKKANVLMFDVVNQYNELIHNILLELMQEAPDGKIYVLTQRN